LEQIAYGHGHGQLHTVVDCAIRPQKRCTVRQVTSSEIEQILVINGDKTGNI
jgi:hypothetical protein